MSWRKHASVENNKSSKSFEPTLNKSHDHVDLYFLMLFSLLVSFLHVLPTAGDNDSCWSIPAYHQRLQQQGATGTTRSPSVTMKGGSKCICISSSRQVFFFHSPFALLTFLQLDYMHVNCDDDIDNEHIATNTNTLTNRGLETQTRLESQVSSFFLFFSYFTNYFYN